MDEQARLKREREILSYLQQKLKAKSLQSSVKADSRKEKTAVRNMTCTFCRRLIPLGTGYVSFRSQGDIRYKGKALRTERMHEPCLNRYLRPGVVASPR